MGMHWPIPDATQESYSKEPNTGKQEFLFFIKLQVSQNLAQLFIQYMVKENKFL